MGEPPFPAGTGKGSPEDLLTRESTSNKVITKQILDEKTGLANGQPTIEVDDSLFLFWLSPLDEKLKQVPRGIQRNPAVFDASSWQHQFLQAHGLPCR